MRGPWIVVVVVASNMITAVSLVGLHWYKERHAFNAAKWRANSSASTCDDAYRQRMSDDLASHYLKVGMSPLNVRWLLGPPDRSELFEGKRLWSYDIGLLGSDCTSFMVVFDRSGRRVVAWQKPDS